MELPRAWNSLIFVEKTHLCRWYVQKLRKVYVVFQTRVQMSQPVTLQFLSCVCVSRLSTNVDSKELLTCFNELGSLWWEALRIESSALGISVTDTDLKWTSFRDSMSDPLSSLFTLEEPDGELTTCTTVTWSNEFYGLINILHHVSSFYCTRVTSAGHTAKRGSNMFRSSCKHVRLPLQLTILPYS